MDLIDARQQLTTLLSKERFTLKGTIESVKYQNDYAVLSLADDEGNDKICIPIKVYQNGDARKGDDIEVTGHWTPFKNNFMFLAESLKLIKISKNHQNLEITRERNFEECEQLVNNEDYRSQISRERPIIKRLAFISCLSDMKSEGVIESLKSIGLEKLVIFRYESNDEVSALLQKIFYKIGNDFDAIYIYHSVMEDKLTSYPIKFEGRHLTKALLELIMNGNYVITTLGDVTGFPVLCNYVHENKSLDTFIQTLKSQRDNRKLKLMEISDILKPRLYRKIEELRKRIAIYNDNFDMYVSKFPPIDKTSKLQEVISAINKRLEDYRKDLYKYDNETSPYHVDQMVYLIDKNDRIVVDPKVPYIAIYYPGSGQMVYEETTFYSEDDIVVGSYKSDEESDNTIKFGDSK